MHLCSRTRELDRSRVAFRAGDLPVEAVLRIAARLDITSDILQFRASCAHTRACLGPREWMFLAKSLEESSDGPDTLQSLGDTEGSEQSLQQLHRAIGVYDATNTTTLKSEDFKTHPGAGGEDIGRVNKCSYFKAVEPGVYNVRAFMPRDEAEREFLSTFDIFRDTSHAFLKFAIQPEGEPRSEPPDFECHLYNRHFQGDLGEEQCMFIPHALVIDDRSDVEIIVSTAQLQVEDEEFSGLAVQLEKVEAAWPSLPMKKRRVLQNEGKRISCACDTLGPGTLRSWRGHF